MIEIVDIFNNKVINVSALSWAIAQVIKITLDYMRNKTFDYGRITGTGGMPSSHSSCVSALTFSIGYQEGFNSPLFAIAFVFAAVVMYDASGIRRAAGKQAEVLNIFIANFEKHGIKIDSKLKELLGHTPIEVLAGAILGLVIATIFY